MIQLTRTREFMELKKGDILLTVGIHSLFSSAWIRIISSKLQLDENYGWVYKCHILETIDSLQYQSDTDISLRSLNNLLFYKFDSMREVLLYLPASCIFERNEYLQKMYEHWKVTSDCSK